MYIVHAANIRNSEERDMKIEMQFDGSDPEAELHHLARCCASFELGTFRNRIDAVKIRLTSVKETRNGRRTNCVVQVELSGDHSVVAESDDANPFIAIHWALERAGWEISCRQQVEACSAGRMPITGRRLVFEGDSNRAA